MDDIFFDKVEEDLAYIPDKVLFLLKLKLYGDAHLVVEDYPRLLGHAEVLSFFELRIQFLGLLPWKRARLMMFYSAGHNCCYNINKKEFEKLQI